jgi:hypothetical protein
MRLGILGPGLLGGKLCQVIVRDGHEVVFSYSHRRDRLEARVNRVLGVQP